MRKPPEGEVVGLLTEIRDLLKQVTEPKPRPPKVDSGHPEVRGD